MTRHGRLRSLLLFQSAMKTADGAGGNAKTWMTDYRAWAEYMPEKGDERVKQGRLRSETLTNVQILWANDLFKMVKPETHRVMMDDVEHQLVDIYDPDQKKRRLTVILKAKANT